MCGYISQESKPDSFNCECESECGRIMCLHRPKVAKKSDGQIRVNVNTETHIRASSV